MKKSQPHIPLKPIKVMTFKRQQGVQIAPRPPGIPQPTPWYYKRVLQNTEGVHFKFYQVEIEQQKNDFNGLVHYLVTYTWGKIGSGGQSQSTILNNQEDALYQVDAKIGDKLGKGYKELIAEAVYPSFVSRADIPHEFVETPESRDKFDAFLNNLKV